MNSEVITAIGYVRVSTDEQAKEGISLDAQEDRIRALARAKGWALKDIIRDAGYSGKSLSRPGTKKLIQLCQEKQTSTVVVYKVDRLTRKQKDLWYLLEEVFEKYRVGFISVTESFDTTTAAGKAFLGMLGVFAQLERDLVSERTREALNHKKAKDEWIGRRPTGFRISESGKLELDAMAMKMISKAKRLRRSGASFLSISTSLGIPKTTVYRLINANMRSLKSNYCKGIQPYPVP